MGNRRLNKKGVRYIYGYFTVEDGFKRWHPNTNLYLTPDQQFKHNRAVDPNFKTVEVVETHYSEAEKRAG